MIEWLKKLFGKKTLPEPPFKVPVSIGPGEITYYPYPPNISLKDPLKPYKWATEEMRTHDTKEVPGSVDNPRIVWYHAHTTLKATDDETPWCSSFMNTCAQETGFPSTHSAAASSWTNFGIKGDGAVGDIAVFKRVGGHHVAFVNKQYKPGDKTISILGGNQKNRVCVEEHDAASLIALRRFVT